jgi:hypothetical protein
MTGTQIQTLAETYLDGDDIEDTDALAWINDFLAEPQLVLEGFRKTGAQSLTVADSETWYGRTAGHLGIVEIQDSYNDKYVGEFELNYDRDKIRIPNPDTYAITSLLAPDALTALSQTPGISTIFHRHCARYIAGKWKLKDDDTNKDGLRMIAEGIQGTLGASRLLVDQEKREQQRQKRSTWGDE